MTDPKYQHGSLVYTKAGLFTLCAWLLWGDFCFTLMESIWPNILPLMLKSEGASNTILGFAITTIPSAMNFFLNPVISTASDRYRSRHGRRIPFLFFATPFIAFFLILLGFSRELGHWAHLALARMFPDIPAAPFVLFVICLLIICFRFFELFVSTVFWYLFNDVVPSAYIGRFLGCFRVVGCLAGAAFNFFLLKHAESHASLIFLGVAVLYGAAFMLMCTNVKEGSYPPPSPMPKGQLSALNYITTFFRECFAHRVYRLVFAFSTVSALGNSINTFVVFMVFSIGLNLGDMGNIAAFVAVASMLLMYPAGLLVDRFHPIRVMLAAQAIFCFLAALKLIFLFYDFPKNMAFWVYVITAGAAIPANVAIVAASLPMVIKVFPREKFGQFCAANAMCASIGTVVGGSLAGVFLDLMKSFFSQGDYYYRFVPVWSIFFVLVTVFVTGQLFREWKKLGGDQSFSPPVPR